MPVADIALSTSSFKVQGKEDWDRKSTKVEIVAEMTFLAGAMLE